MKHKQKSIFIRFEYFFWSLVLLFCSLASINEAYAFAYFEHKFIADFAFYHAINSMENTQIADKLERMFHVNNNLITKEIAPMIRTRHPFAQYTGPFAKGHFQNTFDCADVISEFLRKYKFSFGDLTAMGGDHYSDAKELIKLVSKINDRKGKNDKKFVSILKAVKHEFENVEKWYRKLDAGNDLALSVLPDCYEPSAYEKELFAYLPDFSNLARHNETHFGDKAWKMWQKNHIEALKYAEKIASEELPTAELLENCRADITAMLCYEGFAQHFLSDAFAAGHVRTERKTWFYSPAISEHNHNYDNSHGLHVKMAMPWGDHAEYWRSYGCNCLFTTQAKENLERVIEISFWSLSQILGAAFGEDFKSMPPADLNRKTKVSFAEKREKTILELKRPLAANNRPLAKSDFRDDDLFQLLLENGVLKSNQDDPGLYSFDNMENEHQLKEHLEQIGVGDKEKIDLILDVRWRANNLNFDPPPYRWSGMAYGMSYFFRNHEDAFKNKRSAARLDVGYQYGRSPFYYLPIDYIGGAAFFFPGNEKSFHLVIGSTSFLHDDFYAPLTALVFVDKWFTLGQNDHGWRRSERLKALKLQTKISLGPYYYDENGDVRLETEFIYNFGISIKLYHSLNLSVSMDLIRGLGSPSDWQKPWFQRTGIGIEFVF